MFTYHQDNLDGQQEKISHLFLSHLTEEKLDKIFRDKINNTMITIFKILTMKAIHILMIVFNIHLGIT